MKEKWPGGYVHEQVDGRKLYIIAKMVRGERFHVSTRAHGIKAAMAQLERFEADPHGYSPAGVSEAKAELVLSNALILEHFKWSIEVKGNTRHHAKEMGDRLADWQDDLHGKDLREVTLRDDIKPALDRRSTCRAHRIAAIKGFYGWLRKEKHILTSAEDPTLDLPIPAARPEKTKRRKAVEPERIRAAWVQLKGGYRDMLELLAATGMHVTELERFIRSEESQLVKGDKPLAVLMTRHKTKVLTRIPLNQPSHVAAAERLKAKGTVPRQFRLALYEACDKAGVVRFPPGVLRHSVATNAVEAGATPDEVSRFLHHRDKRTTERFYIDVAKPTNQVPVLQMRATH